MVVSTSTRDSRHFDRVLVPPARTFSFLHPCVNVSKGTVRWEFYRDLKRLVRGKRTNSNKSTNNYMTSIYGTFPSTTEVEAPRDFFFSVRPRTSSTWICIHYTFMRFILANLRRIEKIGISLDESYWSFHFSQRNSPWIYISMAKKTHLVLTAVVSRCILSHWDATDPRCVVGEEKRQKEKLLQTSTC